MIARHRILITDHEATIDPDDPYPKCWSHAMILTLSESDYSNTLLKDESGRALYKITTSSILSGRSTITRLAADGRYHDIAQLKWNAFSPDEVKEQQGRTVDAKDRFPRKGLFSSKRELVASNGRSYVWKEGSSGVKLDPADRPGPRVAEYRKRTLGFFSRGHPGYIEVAHEGVPILDDIVISFVYVEKLRQSRRRSAAGSSAGGAGGAGGC